MSDHQVVSTENHENGLIAIVHCKQMDFAASEALIEAVELAGAVKKMASIVFDKDAERALGADERIAGAVGEAVERAG